MVKGPLSEADKPIRCSMRLPSLWVLTALAIGLESCSPEQAGNTEQERANGLTLSPCYRGAIARRRGSPTRKVTLRFALALLRDVATSRIRPIVRVRDDAPRYEKRARQVPSSSRPTPQRSQE